MAKTSPPLDVLVLGGHPCAYLATELLLARGDVNVIHCTIPQEQAPDRLVLVNPHFFSLHKPLEKLKKKLTLCSVWGLSFLNDDGSTRGEYRAAKCIAQVGYFSQLRKTVCQQAKEDGAKLLTPKSLE